MVSYNKVCENEGTLLNFMVITKGGIATIYRHSLNRFDDNHKEVVRYKNYEVGKESNNFVIRDRKMFQEVVFNNYSKLIA